ncbi:spermidine synthase [Thiomicrorhabdus sp. 6S3-12]|uniref:spermidine synthase n=1 Tax=Thiomicrorhabdus sp. 6S3-12 TaxID=2819681 RepID=UPI001AAD8391|nr:hypothetical protein [Thiomicrorhabdus sp. 6S3-12]MBO1923077.1 hypothetical protein [Thiomicrorhabdus sp. 6S3-12]
MKFNGMIIHTARDEYGLVQVVENRTTRKLHFDSPVEQSCIFRNAPMTLNFEYQQKMIALVNEHFQARKQPKNYRVLMLGMGGGTMAHHLYHSLPNLQMTIVELRRIVIDIAYKFFGLPDAPEIEAVQADAIEYIQELAAECESDAIFKYDAILIDIFDSEGLPSELSSHPFHQAISRCLKPGGRLIFNLWNRIEAGRERENTAESAEVLAYWQNEKTHKAQNQYLMHSTSNLILCLDF